MKTILNAIRYNDFNWKIVSDFKVLTILSGMQGGFTKYPCYLCEWDSRDRKNHYVQKEWPCRTHSLGKRNVINEQLVDVSQIILPPLHIKLGLMKQFVKALDKTGSTFLYLKEQFPKLSEAKIKEGRYKYYIYYILCFLFYKKKIL